MAGFFGNASTGPSLAKALQYVGANTHVLEALRQEQQVGPGGPHSTPKVPTQRMPGCTHRWHRKECDNYNIGNVVSSPFPIL